MKGEIRKEKGDLRSLMSSRLRLIVPCTEIYHYSAGAVLALVIVRSLWIPRASAALIPAQASHSNEKNLWIPWILCEIKTYHWATFPPPAIRTERWKVKVFLSTPSPLRGTPPVSEGESERKGERRNETCEVWCHQDSVLWCLAPKSIIILLARLGLLIVSSLWVPRA